jgi:hypothetical protein
VTVPLGTIIIVPGIGGADLNSQPTLFGLGPALNVWLNPTAMIAGAWRWLGLSADGLTPDTPLTGPLRPGMPLTAYYDVMAGWLRQRGWRVISPSQDWRVQGIHDAHRLVNLIRLQRESAPLHIICHSQGGLIARHAFEILLQSGELGLVGRCAGLGVPHQGSWEAVGLLAGWNESTILLRRLLRAVELPTPGFSILGPVMGVVRSWPSAYELLPTIGAEGVPPWQVAAAYNPATWALLEPPISTAWLSAAKQNWFALVNVPSTVEWVDVVGTGFMTPQFFSRPEKVATTECCDWSTEGDSTVPAKWQTQPGRHRITTPTGHGSYVYDGRVLAALDQYLRQGLEEDIVISGPPLA